MIAEIATVALQSLLIGTVIAVTVYMFLNSRNGP